MKTIYFHLVLLFALVFINVNANTKIDHALGIYLPKTGSQKLLRNLPQIMLNNGITLNQAYFSHQNITLDEGPLEDLLPENEQITEAVVAVREYIKRFLVNLPLESHEFSFDLNDVDLNIDFSNVDGQIIEPSISEKAKGAKLKIMLSVSFDKINVDLGSIKARDNKHAFLGDIGLYGVHLALDQNSEPLEIRIPVLLIKQGQDFIVRVSNIETNLSDVILATKVDEDIELPKIEIKINDHVINVNFEEFQKEFKNNEENLTRSVQSSLDRWLENDSKELFNELIGNSLAEGLNEVNEMAPPGSEEETTPVAPFIWSIGMNDASLVNDWTYINIDGFVSDPTASKNTSLEKIMQAQGAPSFSNITSEESDCALSINQTFINKLLQLSYNRGFINTIDMEDGEVINISKTPYFQFKTKDQPRLAVEIEYNVTGVGAAMVKNPIKIQFDLLVDFPIVNEKVQVIANKIDLESVKVDKKYIRGLFGWKPLAGLVRGKVKDKFEENQNSVGGMELSNDLGIPNSISGVNITPVKTKVDSNGHMLIFINSIFGDEK